MKKIITEQSKDHEVWYLEAREQDANSLSDFVDKLMNGYEHDYATACHAVSAISLATVTALGKQQKEGEMTVNQKHAISFKFIHSWLYPNNKCGLRLINFDEILFKENRKRFTGIPKKNWELIKSAAKDQIDKANKGDIPNVKKGSKDYKFWESILQGKVPFGMKLDK